MPSNTDLYFELGGFRLEVLGRQFPDAQDYWDGNWLRVSSECKAAGSQVLVEGSYVHIGGIVQLRDKLEAMFSNKSKQEEVDFIEPELEMKFSVGSRGDVCFEVWLTPDHLNQSHRYVFELDLSHFPAAMLQCEAILKIYPVKNNEQEQLDRLATGT
jgi:hypothetical protein